ncbi:hypothetical protein H6G27_26470 [Nostoc linckia FACHB-104]|nr:hypothetical protein [Nostoc linckia FACHB-104]
MSLINQQQRKNSDISEPELKPVRVAQVPTSQPQPPIDIPVPPPLETQQQPSFVQPEQPAPIGATSVDESTSQPAQAQEFTAPGVPPLPSELTEPLPPQQPGDIPYYQPFPVDLPPPTQANITATPSILSDVTQEGGKASQWNPTIVNNKLPSVYISTPDLSGTYNQGLQDLGAAVTGYNQKAADTYAEANRTIERIRTSTPNVPEQEKNWFTQGLDYLRDVTFGTQQAQERTAQGNFSPLVGEFGRQGAGLGGLTKYILNTGANVFVGALTETNEAVASALQRIGVPQEQAQRFVRDGFLNLLPDKVGAIEFSRLKPSHIIRFNWEEASKRNSVVDALLGNDVADINDPKESTLTNTGRVYYSRRRIFGDAATEDPLGFALQIATWLANPGDIPVERFISQPIANQVAKRVIAPVGRRIGNIVGLTEATSKPVTEAVTRVELGQTNITQTQVKPVVTETELPLKPTRKPPTPTHVANEIGLGKPSAEALEIPTNVNIRPYQETLAELQQTKPQLLEGYKGNTWQELKEHLANTGEDLSEFTSVRLSEDAGDVFDPSKYTYDDLVNANDELAGHKFVLEAQAGQLTEVLDNSVDFGRRATNDLGYRPTTADELLSTLENGGKPNLHPESFTKVAPEVTEAIRSADYQRLQTVVARSGASLRDELATIATENNRILSEPIAVADTIPTEALTQLPKSLYHGTAIADWKPAYNLSVNGSRGELGHGLYLTRDNRVARDYARALMGENVNPSTLDMDLSPAVYKVEPKLERTLDARANLSKETIAQVIQGLPESILSPLKVSIGKQKNNSYTSILTKLESAIVKGGVDPSEDILVSTQRTIANNLRRLGYDSVYDGKSGFAVVLDEAKVNVIGREGVSQPNALQAVVSRYNADAYAAKYYKGRLTTDANLRDSAAKALNQVAANVDSKLADVQQELIQRQAARLADEGVLPETNLYARQPQPKTTTELMNAVDDIADDLCTL